MEFALIAAAGIAAMIVVLIAIGHWYPISGAEVLDWKPTRSYEDEIELELEEIDQMLEANNERRRRSGRVTLSEEDVRAELDAAQRELEDRARAYRDEATPPG